MKASAKKATDFPSRAATFIAQTEGASDSERGKVAVEKRPHRMLPSTLEGSAALQGEVSCALVTKAVEKYLDFEAFVYWLRPFFQMPKIRLPARISMELGQKCPGLLEFVNTSISAACGGKSKSWKRMFNWGKDHVLAQAKKEGWLDCVLRQVRIHPLHVRIADYAALWCKSRLGNSAPSYPSLRHWQEEAQGYVRASRK
jgi:hypothetical protein